MVLILAVLMFVLAGVQTSWATTWYVATTGSNTLNNGQSVGAPYRTCQKAASVAQAGDTITIADGTYTAADVPGGDQTVDIVCYIRSTYQHGTVSNPITIKATNRAAVTFTIPGAGLHANSGVYVARNYWVVDGIRFAGATGITSTIAHHGVYIDTATGTVVTRNFFDSIARTLCYDAPFGNTGIYATAATSTTIEKNVFASIGRLRNGESGCSTSIFQHDHGMYLNGGTSYVVRNNLIYDTNRGWPIHIYSAAITGLTITNNTIADHCTAAQCPSAGHILLGSSVTTSSIKNNISYDATTAFIYIFSGTYSGIVVSSNLSDSADADMMTAAPGGITSSGNLISTSPGFANAGARDYTLANGSAAINAGADIGNPFNGTAPDIGVFETPRFSACSVENADPHTLQLTFQNSANPPILPTSGVSGVTIKVSGSNDAITSSTRVGTNQLYITFTDPVSFGNTISFTQAGGNVKESALVGGTINQPWVQNLTNQSCVNNVGAASAPFFTQTVFRFNELRGTEAAPRATPYVTAPESTNIFIIPGGSVRLRFGVSCTIVDCPPTGFIPRYSRNGGTYTIVPDVFSTDNIGFCGTSPDPNIPATGTTTTQQLTGSGTFAAGQLIRTSAAVPTVNMALNGRTELEYCFSLDSDILTTDIFTFRLYKDDTTALDAYTVTPQMSLMPSRAGLGF